MSLELLECLGGFWIPNSHSLVHGTCRQPLTIRTPRHAQHPPAVATERFLWCSCVGIPYPCSIIATTRRKKGRCPRRKLTCKNGLTMAGYAVRHTRDSLYPEHSLRFSAHGDSRPAIAVNTKMYPASSTYWERYSKGFVTPCFCNRPSKSVGYWSMITSLPGIWMRNRYGVKSSRSWGNSQVSPP